MGQDEYCRRFVAHTVKTAGFTHFSCGTSVEEYAKETAPSCYGVMSGETPEEDAQADMSYWGED